MTATATKSKTKRTAVDGLKRGNPRKPKLGQEKVQIPALNMRRVLIAIRGTAPYVQNKFSGKAQEVMVATQEAGSKSRKGTAKKPKDFEECFREAMHIAADGWHGIPASAFRNGMIDACRGCGFKMTHAKMFVFVEPDGFDAGDGTPLVKITKGKPHRVEHHVRLASGVCDIRPRPMFDAGWTAEVLVKYDADQFTVEDIANLMVRVGEQIGIGEGRPFSKNSAGVGWGHFTILGKD